MSNYDFVYVHDGVWEECIRVKNECLSIASKGHRILAIGINTSNLKETVQYSPLITIQRVSLPWWHHYSRTLSAEFPIYSWVVERKLKRIIRNVKAERFLVYNLFVFKGAIRAFSSVAPNVPVILDYAEDLPSIIPKYDYATSTAGKLLVNLKKWERLQAESTRLADGLVFVTEEALFDYENRYGDIIKKSATLNNYVNPSNIGFDPISIPDVIEEDGFTLLYFGDTSLRRGTGMIIREMVNIIKVIPEAQLIIIGYNKREQSTLESLIQELNVENNVVLTGYQPLSKLGRFMEISNIGLCPLQRNQHHDTTHANKLYQYMHGGLPLLVSDCIAQRDLVQNNKLGRTFVADNGDSFRAAVQEMYENQELLQEYRDNCIAYAAEHNWDNSIAKFLLFSKNLAT